jgi:hypothetical protein
MVFDRPPKLCNTHQSWQFTTEYHLLVYQPGIDWVAISNGVTLNGCCIMPTISTRQRSCT